MRVLHIHTTTRTGGASVVVRTLLRTQRELGVDASLVGGWGPEEPEAGVLSLDIHRWRNLSSAAVFRIGGYEASFFNLSWSSFLKTRAFQNADVIHLHNAHGYYLPRSALLKILCKPTVWTLHDYWLMTGRCAMPEECVGYRSACVQCPHPARYPGSYVAPTTKDLSGRRGLLARKDICFVAPSKHVAETLEVEVGISHGSVKVVPNPLDLSSAMRVAQIAPKKIEARKALGIPDGAITLLFIARKLSEPRKGLRCFLDALKRLPSRDKIYGLFVGEASADVKRALADTGIQHRVTGMIDGREQLNSYYLAADVLVAPVTMETFGLVLVEAVAAGTSVIATDLPVVRGVLGDDSDWLRLFPYRDDKRLADQIAAFMGNPGRLSDGVRLELIARYSADTAANRYMELYKKALSQSGLRIQESSL